MTDLKMVRTWGIGPFALGADALKENKFDFDF
jgi:hypothetical protein